MTRSSFTGAVIKMMVQASGFIILLPLLWSVLCGMTASRSGQVRAAALERGGVEQRHDALVQLLETPSSQWSPEVWGAIRREVARMLAYFRQPVRDKEDVGERYGEYYLDLVEALSETRDPADIPLLVDVSGSGKNATDCLVRFGDLAVPALLQTVRGKTLNDHLQIGGAMFALADMLRSPPTDAIAPVSDASRRQISAVAQETLEQRLTFNNVIEITDLALATKRPDLRQQLERLAADATEWKRRGLVDPKEIDHCQRIIRAQLASAAK